MTITVPVPLTIEEQAALEGQAKAEGVSVDNLLRRAILQILSLGREVRAPQTLTPEELDRAFEEIADLIPAGTADLPDEALSRESIYTREDEW